jgi:nanoRNase/pAp phosphatase (c-di-AMP/oligoRNAs hydrolase)
LYQDKEVPPLVKYVSDRDVWKFDEWMSKEVNAAIQSYNFTLDTCDMLHQRIEKEGVESLKEEGDAIIRYKDQIINLALKKAEEYEMEGYQIMGTQMASASLISETAEKLAEGRPFGMTWFKAKGEDWVYNLRSRRGGIDVSDVARKFGGGGHSKAAGFSSKLNPVSFLNKR